MEVENIENEFTRRYMYHTSQTFHFIFFENLLHIEWSIVIAQIEAGH